MHNRVIATSPSKDYAQSLLEGSLTGARQRGSDRLAYMATIFEVLIVSQVVVASRLAPEVIHGKYLFTPYTVSSLSSLVCWISDLS